MLKITNEVIESKHPLPFELYGINKCEYVLSLPIYSFKDMVRLNNLILNELTYEDSYYFRCKGNYFKAVKFENEIDLFELK